VIGVTSTAGIGLLGGCEDTHHHYYRASDYRAADRVTYVEPGWYYDREYRSPRGVYYPRTYYYWDGHRWDRRDRVPYGVTARERRHDDHLAHLEHLDHVDRY
jgi:hypothetical protein